MERFTETLVLDPMPRPIHLAGGERASAHGVTLRAVRGGFFLILAMLALGAANQMLASPIDPDLFWHLCVARQLLAQGIHPLIDHLAFASLHRPWTPYSWLAELGMNALWNLGGFRATVLILALLASTLIVLIALTSLELTRATQGEPRYLAAAAATLAGGFMALRYLSFRPDTMALVLLALAAWILQRDRRRKERSRAVWLLPLLTAGLVNIHLYAVFVPLFVAALAFGAFLETGAIRIFITRWPAPRDAGECRRRLHRYLLLALATALGCLATPMLPGVIASAWHYQFHDVMVNSGLIAEMIPFYRNSPLSAVDVGLVLIMLGVAVWKRRSLRAGEWLWLLGALAIALRLGRFEAILSVFGAPVFAGALAGGVTDKMLRHPPVHAVVAGLLIGLGVNAAYAFPQPGETLSYWINRVGPNGLFYPTAAADYVASQIQPRTHHLIAEFDWGGYLEWRLGPTWQPIVDGRTQVFPASVWKGLYLGTSAQRRAYLATVTADAAIVNLQSKRLLPALQSLGWRFVWRDDRSGVLVPAVRVEGGKRNAERGKRKGRRTKSTASKSRYGDLQRGEPSENGPPAGAAEGK